MTDLETAVDQLHAVPLEDFVAERKRLAKELRGAGERESAAQLAKLPKPSAPAWALNQLAREQPESLGEWLGAAEALRDASARADRSSGDMLRAAMAAHRDATRRLLAGLREHARPNGRKLSEPMLDRVRELLQAATADPARAEQLRGGRVVEDDAEAPELPAPAATPKRAAKKPDGGETKDRETRAEKERAERAAKARAELEALVAAAEERLAELHEAAEERGAAAEQAEERLEEARRTLHRSESEAAAALQAAEEAADAVEQGERELRTLNAKLSS